LGPAVRSERFGSHVYEAGAPKEQTQQQIAKLAGVPRATWANLESGAANPTLAVLVKIAAALSVYVIRAGLHGRVLAVDSAADAGSTRQRGARAIDAARDARRRRIRFPPMAR